LGAPAAVLVGAGSRVRAAVAGGGALYCAAKAAAVATNWKGMWIDTLLFEHVFRGHYPEWLILGFPVQRALR